jgi:DNA-binding NtrC family response regulator
VRRRPDIGTLGGPAPHARRTPLGVPESTPTLRAMHPEAARWIGALIRMTAPHPAMTAILDVVERLQDRPYRTNFVLLGEPGTGKEGLARALHHLVCPEGPLVRFDVAGFTDDDALTVLCGAGRSGGKAGAGTAGPLPRGAAHDADGGTLLIEETAGLGPRTQAALMRLLKSGRLDPRGDRDRTGGDGQAPDSDEGPGRRLHVNAIAVSDRDLEAEVRAGRLRHDLYWRLARLVLTLPPLRERIQDIGPSAVWMGNRMLRAAGSPAELMLSEAYLRASPDERRRAIELAPDAIQALEQHDWPGNFRELEAVLERALLLHHSGPALNADAILRARGA